MGLKWVVRGRRLTGCHLPWMYDMKISVQYNESIHKWEWWVGSAKVFNRQATYMYV